MSLMFWRRKNAKLASRLTNLVDAAERAKKTRRRQTPRVMIDTTYLARDEDGAEAASEIDLPVPGGEPAEVPIDGDATDTVAPRTELVSEPPEHSADDGHDDDIVDDDEVGEGDVLREAIAQLDEAEAREAQMRVGHEALRREADAQRERLVELEALIARERAAREAAEGEVQAALEQARAAAVVVSPSAVMGMDAAERAKRDLAEAQAREATARQTADAQRVLVNALQSDIEREQAERAAAVQSRDVAERELNEVRSMVRSTAARVEELERAVDNERALRGEAEAALAAQVAAQKDAAEAARSQIATLEADVGREQSQRVEVEAQLAEAETQLSEARKRNAALDAELGEAVAAQAALGTELAQGGNARAELAADLAKETEARTKLEGEIVTSSAELGEARQTVALHEAALGELRGEVAELLGVSAEVREQLTSALARAAAAEGDVARERARLAELDAELATERAARQAADAEYAAAAQTADQLARKLLNAEQTQEKSADSAMSATEFQSLIEAAQTEAEGQRRRVRELEETLASVRAAFGDATAQREGADKRAADAQLELEELRRQLDARAAVELPSQPTALTAAERAQEGCFEGAAAEPDENVVARESAPASADKSDRPSPSRPSIRKNRLAPQEAQAQAEEPVVKTAVGAQLSLDVPPVGQAEDASPISRRIAKAVSAKERAKDHRRAKRVTSQKLGSLWNEGMSAALSCTMLDRSSTGAKLEVLTDRYNDRINELSVGDRFTLTTSYAQERTSIACEVMWVAGRRCGVRFVGQIVTEQNKPAKRAMTKKAPQKVTATTAIASLFGSSGR